MPAISLYLYERISSGSLQLRCTTQAEAEAACRAAEAAAADLGAWQAAVAERDAELQNLQAGLEHLDCK